MSKVLDLPNSDDWDEYLNVQSSILKKTNVSFLYDNLEKQDKIINDIKSRTLDLDFTKTMTLVNVVVISVTLACVFTACFIYQCKCCKKDANKKDKINDKAQIDCETDCEDKHEISSDNTTKTVDFKTTEENSTQRSVTKASPSDTLDQIPSSSKTTNIVIPQTHIIEKTAPDTTSSGLRNRSLSANKRPGPVTLNEIEKTV